MKVFVDTNILIDVLTRRAPFYRDSVEVWALARRFTRPGSLVDRIFEDPPQSDIPGIYQQCDLLLKTSVMEGFLGCRIWRRWPVAAFQPPMPPGVCTIFAATV